MASLTCLERGVASQPGCHVAPLSVLFSSWIAWTSPPGDWALLPQKWKLHCMSLQGLDLRVSEVTVFQSQPQSQLGFQGWGNRSPLFWEELGVHTCRLGEDFGSYVYNLLQLHHTIRWQYILYLKKNVTWSTIVIPCCFSLSSPDAHILLPIWSVPYLNHAAVPAHGLCSVQCSEGSADAADSTTSRYLESVSHFLL